MEKMINVTINGMPLEVPVGTKIIDAAKQIGINIPTLCYLKEINEIGACRICVVEVKGAKSLVSACTYPLEREGTEVLTNTKRVQDARQTTLELILSNHERKCLSCHRNSNCELQKMCHDFGVTDEYKYDGANPQSQVDVSTLHLVRDNSKCILCRRCIAACDNQVVGIIGANNRGFDTEIGCAFDVSLANTSCVSCGQCTSVCPTAALTERDQTKEVFKALQDPEKFVVVQTAPSIRVTLGECFGMPIGSNVKGKMVTALKMLGFSRVFDTDFGADLTILEEASELIHRVKNDGVLPVITSCSPGWVKFCEHYYPDLLPHLSTCKSPQQMTGAIIKTYYAEKRNIDPKNIVVVSIMPCTAKKFESTRDHQDAAGFPDVDIALTTRELGNMIKAAQLDFPNLPDSEFDPALGEATGAAAIFGATGGVMEAALRSAADMLSGQQLERIDYNEVRGQDGIKEATYDVGGLKVRVAVASGLKNAAEIMEKIKNGEAEYEFVEIMCCPGGCVNGGGQPVQPAYVRNFVDLKDVRARALYEEDKSLPIRKSHESPLIKKVYDNYLGEPGSHKAHEILHTAYVKRNKHLTDLVSEIKVN